MRDKSNFNRAFWSGSVVVFSCSAIIPRSLVCKSVTNEYDFLNRSTFNLPQRSSNRGSRRDGLGNKSVGFKRLTGFFDVSTVGLFFDDLETLLFTHCSSGALSSYEGIIILLPLSPHKRTYRAGHHGRSRLESVGAHDSPMYLNCDMIGL